MSGSDIAVVVRDALMEPVRKVQLATHFKPVMVPSRADPTVNQKYLTPCSPGDMGAIEMNWMGVSSDELLEPDLTISDFLKAVTVGRKSVNDSDINQYVEWTAEFGQDG